MRLNWPFIAAMATLAVWAAAAVTFHHPTVSLKWGQAAAAPLR